VTHLDFSLLFYIYIIIKSTTQLIRLFICIIIIDNQANVQKRKRASTVQNEHAIECVSNEETTIIIDTSHYKKPSNIKDNSNDSNVEQPDSTPIQESTLF
jgi:hypothetical protein